jgi:hypothetical protein
MQWSGPVVTLVQTNNEEPRDFARRVAYSVERLGRERAVLQRLALVVQDDFSPAMRSARSEMLGIVALHLVRLPIPLTIHFVGIDDD